MLTGQLPTEAQLIAIDHTLATEGVSIIDRPDKAMFHWATEIGSFPGDDLGEISRWFTDQFAKLHPSVDFTNRPFALMCVSALGIAYQLDPPMIVGTVAIDPLAYVKITPQELGRLAERDPALPMELRLQAADGIEFFMNNLSILGASPAALGMLRVGYSHLEAGARQILAGAGDSSMPHAMATAVEVVTKSMLTCVGLSDAELFKIGHRLDKAAETLAAQRPAVNDQTYIAVARSIPQLVASRYGGTQLNLLATHDLYRRAMFLCAEALRRYTGASIVPPSEAAKRKWETVPNTPNAC